MGLAIIEHPLTDLQCCISLRYHTSCRGSAVFLAEPVSDILAAAVTTITFFTLFNKILKKEVR